MLNNDYAPGFIVDHFIKDMGIALSESARMNLCLPGLSLVHQFYKSLQVNGGSQNGTQALMKVLE